MLLNRYFRGASSPLINKANKLICYDVEKRNALGFPTKQQKKEVFVRISCCRSNAVSFIPFVTCRKAKTQRAQKALGLSQGRGGEKCSVQR